MGYPALSPDNRSSGVYISRTSVAMHSSRGYSLIEIIIVVVILGILASVSIRALRSADETARFEETRTKLQHLAEATAGSPSATGDAGSDFGFIGDNGTLPTSVNDLFENPGGWGTWNGPYIEDRVHGGGARYFAVDGWGAAIVRSGVEYVSTGSGSTVSYPFGTGSDDLLYNPVTITITDIDLTPPGPDYKDSLVATIEYPDGSGDITTRSASPDASGFVQMDSIPIGVHTLRIVYTPDSDTLTQRVTVRPGSRFYADINHYADLWSGSVAGCGGSGTMVLRPDGSGSVTNLTTSGCGANWQCVDETVADEGGSYVERAHSGWVTDVYTLEDPADTGCTIQSVTVYCRARREHNQGRVRPTVYIGGSEYQGSNLNLTTVWADYGHEWTSNPATGAAWTWTDIINLEAGPRLRGQSTTHSAFCTQVWVEVAYGE